MSVYPGDFDSLPNPAPTDTEDGSIGGKTHSSYWSDIHSAVRAIQQTLGLNPQGSYATVLDSLTAKTNRGPLDLYLDPLNNSDLSGYKTALTIPSAEAETSTTTSVTGTSDVLVASFATEPGVPGVTTIPAGTALRHFHAMTGAAARIARVKTEFYTCDADGSNETLRRTDYSPNFGSTSMMEVLSANSDSNSYSIGATDRIVIKVYAARVSGVETFDVTLYWCGTANASFLQTTIWP
jgi:hypothetical protein